MMSKSYEAINLMDKFNILLKINYDFPEIRIIINKNQSLEINIKIMFKNIDMNLNHKLNK